MKTTKTIQLLLVLFILSSSPAHAQTQAYHLIAFAGDSIMVGIPGATSAGNGVVGRLVSLEPSWFIQNYSYLGASMSGGTLYTGAVFPPMNPGAVFGLLDSTVVVFLGTNDWGLDVPLQAFTANYTKFISTLDLSRPNGIFVTPIWRKYEGSLNGAGYNLATMRAAIAKICAEHGHPVVDGLTLVPHDSANYLADGLHPNDTGYSHYAPNLAAAIAPLLK
jgi:lysophospholipase L1-like esterase